MGMVSAMQTILRHKGVGPLLFAQSQVAFNDNCTKLVLIGLVQMLLVKEQASMAVSLIALLLVAPFLLFAPLSGWLSDRFPKRQVFLGSLWLQLGVMLGILAAVYFHAIFLAVAGFFFLGAQSALMGPARRGMVKDLAGDSVGEVVGWMEMLCIAAILEGSFAGGQMIDGLVIWLKFPWTAALAAIGLLVASCAVALLSFRQVPWHPAATATPFSSQAVFGHIGLLKTLHRNRAIWRASLGDSAFYLAGGILMLTLTELGRNLHPSGLGAASATGLMVACMGSGIALGSVGAAFLCRRTINLGIVPCGALGMSAALFALPFLSGVPFFAGLLVLGICGGLYLVPLGAYMVDRSPEEERGRILAAASMLSSFAGVIAVGLHALAQEVFHLGTSGQFVLVGFWLFIVAVSSIRMLPDALLRLLTYFLASRHYTVTAIGAKNIPAKGGALMVCNHVTYIDTIILSLASPRPIRFLGYDEFFEMPVLGDILRIFGAIPVSSKKAKEAIVVAARHVSEGELVCIFPEGQLTRTGCLMELKSGFELIARRAKAPVIVAHMDGLWGSIFSFEGGRYFTKWPQSLKRKTIVSFAPLLTTREATAPRVREIILALGEAAFRRRPITSLPDALIDALSARRIAMTDQSTEKKIFRAHELLAASWELSLQWRTSIPERRAGLILPPGFAGTVANLGLILAGKIPVNLNPTLAEAAATACLERAGIKTLITAEAVTRKMSRFPWPAHTLLIEDSLKALSKRRLHRRGLACLLLPKAILKRGRPSASINEEAILLFTSGSSGLPKGVALTHRNILANATQIQETGFLQKGDSLLSALPLFHSFGLTMGLLCPLLAGRTIVSAQSPLDSDRLAEAARADSPTILLATPTFLRSYIKRIPRDAFGTLRLAVTGAEQLPETTVAAFRERFGCDVLEGYGLTEASPVASLNLPHPARGLGADTSQLGWRPGSVGRLLPGVALRFLDPETNRHVPGASRGLLAIRGANIITNYMSNEAPEKFDDGWFITGDIIRVDEEGFLFVEGRLSRFAKIGGEMISHTAVEAILSEAFGAEHRYCVVGRPSTEKGEELVLLTTASLTRDEIREKVAGKLPNLALPKHVIPVEQLPMLGSGKLDLAECQRLASLSNEPTV
ncbi:acyl-[ACP]--phospholipid O-acyltransferase [soil metagenome]